MKESNVAIYGTINRPFKSSPDCGNLFYEGSSAGWKYGGSWYRAL